MKVNSTQQLFKSDSAANLLRSEHIKWDQIRILYGELVIGVIGSALGTSVIALSVYSHVPDSRLLN